MYSIYLYFLIFSGTITSVIPNVAQSPDWRGTETEEAASSLTQLNQRNGPVLIFVVARVILAKKHHKITEIPTHHETVIELFILLNKPLNFKMFQFIKRV